ncbi:MAG: tRNA (adenosine(37)-N6)-threonylcarbamoyltransferase complex ATPase subunit type 1 TsaE [Sebaldella sp.]|nr:tRNA (adenosine(37)-N6)-threonylcarbamoyltransferase complex ATPase subunit type 1 TsaE [Sebaldella sp.]
MKDVVLTFEELDELALKTAESLKKGDCLALIGDLGTGKTTFTKKICKYFGVTENIKSPTFNYVIEYNSGVIPIYHFDVYRLLDPSEVYDIGYEDYLDNDGIAIIEWADKIIDELPENALFIEFIYNDDSSRKVSIYKIIDGEKKYVDIRN